MCQLTGRYWHVAVQCPKHDLPRLLADNLIVIAVRACLDTIKAILDLLGKAEGTRVALLQVVQSAPKYPLVHWDPPWETPEEALVAVPLIWKLVLFHIDALKMERARAAITAEHITCIPTG